MKYLILFIALLALLFVACKDTQDDNSDGGDSGAGFLGGGCAYECLICCPDVYVIWGCHEGPNLNSQADCNNESFSEIAQGECFNSSQLKYYPDYSCYGLCERNACDLHGTAR